MNIQTVNFGEQPINTADIINFPKGLIGLSEQKDLKLFHEEGDNQNIHFLQSISDAEFSMSVVTPEALDLDYEITLDDDELESLQLADMSDAVVLLALYKPSDAHSDIKAAVKSPIIINTKTMRGLQKSVSSLITTH